MAGHRRGSNGSPICPPGYEVSDSRGSGVPTPPSPATTNGGGPRTPPRPLRRHKSPSTEALKMTRVPGGKWWHWRNPNWNDESAYEFVDPADPPPFQRVDGQQQREFSPTFTEVSTVLCDEDGRTIHGGSYSQISSERLVEESLHPSFSFSESSFASNASIETIGMPEQGRAHQASQALGSSSNGAILFPPTPPESDMHSDDGSTWGRRLRRQTQNRKSTLAVFEASPSEVPEIQQAARRLGLYAAPLTGMTTQGSVNDPDFKATVVVGSKRQWVDNLTGDKTVSNMPGALPAVGAAPTVSFLHLILASILGGCVVVLGLSYIPGAASAATHL
ncbi:hypothetical protein CC2G_010195 [Coprinopsis cinerea AmutBmut pab1-1]|nr:hypothetical protein CC2G_010195 [Coprinopsis cinerea AmutBmut pab1-1]